MIKFKNDLKNPNEHKYKQIPFHVGLLAFLTIDCKKNTAKKCQFCVNDVSFRYKKNLLLKKSSDIEQKNKSSNAILTTQASNEKKSINKN